MIPRAGKGVRPGPGSVVLTRDEGCEVGAALWLASAVMVDGPTKDTVESAMILMGRRGAILPTPPKDEQEGATA